MEQQPTYGNGKICYLEIPAGDLTTSASFYHKVFGWKIRTRDDGSLAFDDGVNQVSGTWVLNKAPHAASGLLVYIMVDSLTDTAALITAHGGRLIRSEQQDKKREIIAQFHDPYGNIFGIFQQ